LGTSLARPVIAKHQVEVALREGATAVAHGCTGKGNDQVRFELTYQALAPELKVIAPWREWTLKSREDCLDYAEQHGIPVAASREKIHSRDRNLWHLSHEGGELEDAANAPLPTTWQMTRSPQEAPDKEEQVTIGFEKGNPVSVGGMKLDPVSLVELLNEIGARNAIGRVDLVENRFVGIKSRGCYETPGGTLLIAAHRELEALVPGARGHALQAACSVEVRGAGLFRIVVHAVARGAGCFRGQHANGNDRQRDAVFV
jgi:argininosuccinate synthase